MVRRSDGLKSSAKNLAAISRDAGPPPSRIAPSKWSEIQDEEDANGTINSIREEIVQAAMNISTTNYIDEKSYSFVVNCAHTAWLQLFNWMNLKCNGSVTSRLVEERWTGDDEPATVPMDNWVCGNVAVRQETKTLNVETEICEAMCSQKNISNLVPRNMSSPPLQQTSDSSIDPVAHEIVRDPSGGAALEPVIAGSSVDDDENVEVGAEEVTPAEIEVGTVGRVRSQALSIFTRDITVPRRKLPIARSSSGQNGAIVGVKDPCKQKSCRSWRLDCVEPPRKLSSDRLPPNRLDIKYAPMADSRSSSNGRVNTKKKTSSKLPTRGSTSLKPRRQSETTSQP